MAGVDDEWESFLTQGAVILSNEKNSAKNNVTNSYQKNMDSTMTSYTAIIDTHVKNNIVSCGSETKSTRLSEYTKNCVKQPINLSSSSSLTQPARRIKKAGRAGYIKEVNNGECHGGEDLGLDLDLDLDDEYDSTCIDKDADDGYDNTNDNAIENIDDRLSFNGEQQPVCSKIYISTKTKISYLNEPIDIKKVFWSIPISSYSTPNECIIKKQIKVSTTDPTELKEIRELLKNEKYYQEQEIEHIDNPEGRIKFKVQLKINVGLCKKDILNYRCKLKRAFFNCFVLIMRIRDQSGEGFKEMHIKVFNTGKLEIPGIQTDDSLHQVLTLLITTLKPIIGSHIDYIRDKCETVLINSNFNCGYFINRDKLYNMLKYKYRINSNYDACSYPGIQSKFYYIPGLETQTGQHPPANEVDKANEISFMIFRTGSVLIVGRCDEHVLHCIYEFLKKILEIEYPEIGNKLNIIQPKKLNVKLRRKVINVIEDI